MVEVFVVAILDTVAIVFPSLIVLVLESIFEVMVAVSTSFHHLFRCQLMLFLHFFIYLSLMGLYDKVDGTYVGELD